MQVWAQRSGMKYVLLPDDADRHDVDMETPGRILDVADMKLYPWQRAQSIIAQGYWDEATADDLPDALDALIDAADVLSVEESGVPRDPHMTYPPDEPQ